MTGEPWPFTVDELHAMAHATSGIRTGDDTKIAYWSERVGPVVVDRARARAVEIVADAAAQGSLDLLAGHLSRRCFLSGGDVARILERREHA